jgi:hypothetical protein
VFVGDFEYAHTGGPCARGDGYRQSDDVRAVIAGNDFFAVRNSQSSMCVIHGSVQGDEVRGYDCNGEQPKGFALKLRPDMDLRGRDRDRPAYVALQTLMRPSFGEEGS